MPTFDPEFKGKDISFTGKGTPVPTSTGGSSFLGAIGKLVEVGTGFMEEAQERREIKTQQDITQSLRNTGSELSALAVLSDQEEGTVFTGEGQLRPEVADAIGSPSLLSVLKDVPDLQSKVKELRKLRAGLEQFGGSSRKNALRITAQSRVKTLLAQYPQHAKEIREISKDVLGFDAVDSGLITALSLTEREDTETSDAIRQANTLLPTSPVNPTNFGWTPENGFQSDEQARRFIEENRKIVNIGQQQEEDLNALDRNIEMLNRATVLSKEEKKAATDRQVEAVSDFINGTRSILGKLSESLNVFNLFDGVNTDSQFNKRRVSIIQQITTTKQQAISFVNQQLNSVLSRKDIDTAARDRAIADANAIKEEIDTYGKWIQDESFDVVRRRNRELQLLENNLRLDGLQANKVYARLEQLLGPQLLSVVLDRANVSDPGLLNPLQDRLTSALIKVGASSEEIAETVGIVKAARHIHGQKTIDQINEPEEREAVFNLSRSMLSGVEDKLRVSTAPKVKKDLIEAHNNGDTSLLNLGAAVNNHLVAMNASDNPAFTRKSLDYLNRPVFSTVIDTLEEAGEEGVILSTSIQNGILSPITNMIDDSQGGLFVSMNKNSEILGNRILAGHLREEREKFGIGKDEPVLMVDKSKGSITINPKYQRMLNESTAAEVVSIRNTVFPKLQKDLKDYDTAVNILHTHKKDNNEIFRDADKKQITSFFIHSSGRNLSSKFVSVEGELHPKLLEKQEKVRNQQQTVQGEEETDIFDMWVDGQTQIRARLKQGPEEFSISFEDKNPSGTLEEGNIDLENRPRIENPNGSFSTIESMSFQEEIGGPHILVPTIVDGKRVSAEEAIRHYQQTGEHLGKFRTPEEATSFAKELSNKQGQRVRKKGGEISEEEMKEIDERKNQLTTIDPALAEEIKNTRGFDAKVEIIKKKAPHLMSVIEPLIERFGD